MKESDKYKIPIIVVVGPTASGKSRLAVELAKKLDAEVVSADSMQLYRHMDIGTAKPAPEEMEGIPHHMIDIVDPDEEFSVSDYREMASGAIAGIHGRGRAVIVAGGSGLYIRALTKGLVDTPKGDPLLREELKAEAEDSGVECLHERLKKLDPAAALNIHPNNVVRVIRALEVAILSSRKISDFQQGHSFSDELYDVMMLGIALDRDLLYRRIEERVDAMIGAGLKGEVQALLDMGYGRELKPMRGVGYKEICAHILDGLPIGRAIELIKRDSRRYAKRQMTWFRKESVEWLPFDGLAGDKKIDEARAFLS